MLKIRVDSRVVVIDEVLIGGGVIEVEHVS
jgi:hypothetical protein